MIQHDNNSSIVPSARFLNPTQSDIAAAPALSDRGTSFIGANTGFLPPVPLSPLPPSHHRWQDVADQLPATVRSGQWKSFISRIPELSISGLDDCHLLRANMCLGAIAHALQNVADVDVPECVMRPWTAISKLLERPTASFNSLDWFIYNYDLIPQRFVRHVGSTSTTTSSTRISSSDITTKEHTHSRQNRLAATDAWLHSRPLFTVSGTVTETHFIIGCHSIELAAAHLPGLVTRVQQAVQDDNVNGVFAGLCDVAIVVEKMTTAFRSADMRPGAATYVDGLEWGRVIGITGLAVVPGEKTISGLLFPSIHLLDVFLGRSMYSSEMGVLEASDRKWLPPLHRAFFEAVEKTSVMDYVMHRKESHPRLMACFQHTVATFAGETGFLGKHRLRIVGFLELSMKVGRPATAAGTMSPKWQRRTWRHINKAMTAGMHERLKNANIPAVTGAGPVCQSTIMQVAPVNGNYNNNHECDASVFRVVLNTDGRLLYSPGDHIGVMPRNSTVLVDATLDALDMQRNETVVVQNKTWQTMLHAYYEYGKETDDEIANDKQISMTAQEFLSMAMLQPLGAALADRLIHAMSVTDPVVMAYLRGEAATNVAMAVHLIRNTGGNIPPCSLRSTLDCIFEPLAPRYYSVSSHRSFTPSSVELIVGRVQYQPSYCRLPCDDDSMIIPPLHSSAAAMMKFGQRASISMPSLHTAYTKHLEEHELKASPSWSSLDSFPSSSSSEKPLPSSCCFSSCSDIDGSTAADENGFDDVGKISSRDSDFDSNYTENRQFYGPTKNLHAHTQELSKVTVDTDIDLPIFSPSQSNPISQVLQKPATIDHKSNSPNEHMLEGVSSSFLTRSMPGTTVPIFTVPELDFRLPEEVIDVPVVLLSLGTGLAPFRSFLKELILRKQRGGCAKANKAWLIMGLQTKARIPFIDEIQDAVCQHSVADVSFAFSREDIELDLRDTRVKSRLSFRPGKRKRVQGLFEQYIDAECEHKMDDREEEDLSQRLWQVLRNGGHIFACGKPDLEPLVRELVSFAVRKCAPASIIGTRTFFDASNDLDALARGYGDRMFAEKRIHIDAYYSGRPTSVPLTTSITNISNKIISNFNNVNGINNNNNNNNKALIYSHSNVARHRHATDCWVTFRNGVYDLTKYLAVHPGGPKLLLDKAGRDLTEDFNVAHGRDNERVVSMLLPYRVGTMDSYTSGSWNNNKNSRAVSNLKSCIMDKWSVPLLQTVLEHRSVFLLDVNRFDTLLEPPSHTAFKSQIDQPGGLASIVVDKFRSHYEPDLFNVIHNAVGNDQLGAAVGALHRSYYGATAPTSARLSMQQGVKEDEEELMFDGGAVQGRIEQIRNVRFHKHDVQNLPPEMYMERSSKFFNDMVATCVEMQRIVENALEDWAVQGDFEDLCTVLLADLVRKMSEGIEHAYEGLLGNRH